DWSVTGVQTCALPISPVGSPELDSEFVSTFRSAPSNVTRSIDAAVQLIETDLRGWWWNCGYCEVTNGASLYVPGSSRIRANFPRSEERRVGKEWRYRR